MKIYNKVRGTMEYVPTVEVSKDTVYIRSDIERIEEMEFSGWEYNEIQMSKDKYLEKLQQENENLEKELTITQAVNKTNMVGVFELANRIRILEGKE